MTMVTDSTDAQHSPSQLVAVCQFGVTVNIQLVRKLARLCEVLYGIRGGNAIR